MGQGDVGRVVRAPKTAELIATQLRGQVVRGELTPGQALPPESELMQQFGVSRPTLREAFRVLETESLIEVRRGSHGGARVVSPDLAVAARYVGLLLQISGTTISDVHEARAVLEPACARRLAERAQPEDVAALRQCVQDLAAALKAPEPAQLSALTYRFHELVLQRSGSRTLAVQAGVLRGIVETHTAQTVSRTLHSPGSSEDFRRLVRSFGKLADLVEAPDAEGAEQHWRSHMQASANKLLSEGPSDAAVVDLFS
ncbi:MAG: regulatory protein GntR [Frankiales bacterium]|nr:regulatory protein GntR [Frankiales bacterium]